MLSKSTESAASAPITGRSGWDVLVQYKFSFLALIAITFIFFMDIFYPEKLSDWIDSLYYYMEIAKPYIVPTLFGAIAGRFVYKNWVYQPIYVSVSDTVCGDAEYRLSQSYFNRITKTEGYCNPIGTRLGRIKYVATDYNPKEKTLNFGWVHSSSVSPDHVFAFRESFNALLEDYATKSRRVVQLESMPMIEGTEIGLATVRRDHNILAEILGIANPKVSVNPDTAVEKMEKGVDADE